VCVTDVRISTSSLLFGAGSHLCCLNVRMAKAAASYRLSASTSTVCRKPSISRYETMHDAIRGKISFSVLFSASFGAPLAPFGFGPLLPDGTSQFDNAYLASVGILKRLGIPTVEAWVAALPVGMVAIWLLNKQKDKHVRGLP
jgi:hypothetical protein